MSRYLPQFVNTNQFTFPALYPATRIFNQRVLISDVDFREVDVLQISVPIDGNNIQTFLYSLARREATRTRLGYIIIGIELQYIPGTTELYSTSRAVVIKVSNIGQMLAATNGIPRRLENPLHEIAAMQLLGDSHPNVNGQILSGFDEENVYVVMQYPNPAHGLSVADGMHFIQDVLRGRPLRSEAEIRNVFGQLMTGIAHMHSLGIAHRDLALENILIVADQQLNIFGVRIIDFGLAWRLFDQLQVQLPYPPAFYGRMPYYAPPEVVTHQNNPTYQMDPRVFDIWAAGIMLFMLCTGMPLFSSAEAADSNFAILLQDPINGLRNILYSQIPNAPAELVDLLADMLRIDPLLRPTAAAVLQYPWFRS